MTATAKDADRGERVVDREIVGQNGEHGQVDQVARAADQTELDQLQPASRPPGGGTDAIREFGGLAHSSG